MHYFLYIEEIHAHINTSIKKFYLCGDEYTTFLFFHSAPALADIPDQDAALPVARPRPPYIENFFCSLLVFLLDYLNMSCILEFLIQ